MRFEEAITKMQEGKKIRRPHWDKDLFWQEKDGMIDNGLESGSPLLDFTNFLADDWEVVEEKKPTLSDEIKCAHLNEGFIDTENVKEFIQKLKSAIENILLNVQAKSNYDYSIKIDEKIDELAGERLTK